MAEQFDTIAHKLNISANLIRKNSMHSGNLDGDCMIIALSLMTKKSYDIIAKDLIRISNDRDRSDCSVGIDFINEYNKNSSNKYIFVPLKKNGICYNTILRNRDKDLMLITDNHAFCYVNGKIIECKEKYHAIDLNGCKTSFFVFERKIRPKTYKYRKIGYDPFNSYNMLNESKFLLKSLGNVKYISSKDEEYLSNFPILTLSKLLDIPYKEAAISMIMNDNSKLGISATLLYDYISKNYECISYNNDKFYSLYTFLTSEKIKKTDFMIVYVKVLINAWKNKIIPVGIKRGVILVNPIKIETLLTAGVQVIQYIE